MAFMSLEIIFFRYKQVLHNLAFFFLVELIPSFINERSHNTFQVKGSKKIDVEKSIVLIEFVMT